MSNNTSHNIGFTSGNGELKLYVDGTLTDTFTSSLADGSLFMQIESADFTTEQNLYSSWNESVYLGGINEDPNAVLNGSMKNAGIWNRVLSQEEIDYIQNKSYEELETPTELTGEISLDNLNEGWYDLTLQIKTGGIPLSDTVHETFRIVKAIDTEAELVVTADEIYVGAAGFSVIVDMDNMINVELTSEIVGTDIIITAITTDAITGNSVEAGLTWYLNGEVLSDIGSSITIDTTTATTSIEGLRIGVNKVTCRAENEGALGNSHVTFTIE